MTDNREIYDFNKLPPIKGYPELKWTNKRAYKSTMYYPAQLKESYGTTDEEGWINKIFWGDNLQVMSHMLKVYRGKIDLIYIDPPFDSKANYKKKIKLKIDNKEKTIFNDSLSFEEKQYSDIWTNDEYLQFMYERLTLMRELLSDSGTILVHCDYHKGHHLRCILDEVFGTNNFINEIIWGYQDIGSKAVPYFKRKHDNIFMYSKTNSDLRIFNTIRGKLSKSTIDRYKPYFDEDGKISYKKLKETNPGVFSKLKGVPDDLNEIWLDENNGQPLNDWWFDISALKSGFNEHVNYPTQKPEALLERIITATTNEGSIVFDCFMGSGTTQAVAAKLNRKYIGADINLGAIQTSTKRLLDDIENEKTNVGFEVYNVNDYDFFRNELEAKQLIIDALEIQQLNFSNIYDGELDGRMIKIMPTNRITTKADLNELIANLPYNLFAKRKEESPKEFVERITIVCMGHEPDLKASFLKEVGDFRIDVEIVDILRDKSNLQLKRNSEGSAVIRNNKVIIESFFPMNLLQKLSLDKQVVDNWKQLVESVMVDFNYDGAILTPKVIDIPQKGELVKGVYDIPSDAGNIRIKITDILSESLEIEVRI